MNTKNPSISVVIPAYNEEKYLPRCLSSLKKQTFQDFEVIVVDNNSTDKTAEIALKYGAKVVRENTQGMTPARERGFREAKAEIIARTDADTIVSPTWLQTIYHTFISNPDIVALSGSFTSPYHMFPSFIFHFYMIFLVTLTRFLTGHISLHGPNLAVRKSAWQKTSVHKNDKIIHEDIDLSCHMAKTGRMLFLPQLTTTYSLRRMRKNLLSTVIDYPLRYNRTIYIHVSS